MRQIYIEGCYGNGYSRFMKYVNNVINPPKRGCIEKRVLGINFFDEFGAEATRKAFGKSRSTILQSTSGSSN